MSFVSILQTMIHFNEWSKRRHTLHRMILVGMVSHKMSQITIFGHKHFRQKFDILYKKISTASDFGSYLVLNFRL